MNQLYYTISFSIALVIAIIYGSKRNIGLFWSIFFCVFANFLAIPIIFLSKKKTEKEPPSLINIGLMLLLMNFFAFYATREEFITDTIKGFSIPVLIYTQNISTELAGYYIGKIIFLLLAIYFLTRELTLKYLINKNIMEKINEYFNKINRVSPKILIIIITILITLISIPFFYFKYEEISKLKRKEEIEQKLVKLKNSVAKLKIYPLLNRNQIGLDSIQVKTKYLNGNMLIKLDAQYVKGNSYFQTSVKSLNIRFHDKDDFVIYAFELNKAGEGYTNLVNDKRDWIGFMFENKYPVDINIYNQFSKITIAWVDL